MMKVFAYTMAAHLALAFALVAAPALSKSRTPVQPGTAQVAKAP